MARLTALLFLPVLIQSALSISFFLPVNTRKCLREEIHKDVLVTGEYEISEQANTKTNLKVSTYLRIANVSATIYSNILTTISAFKSWFYVIRVMQPPLRRYLSQLEVDCIKIRCFMRFTKLGLSNPPS